MNIKKDLKIIRGGKIKPGDDYVFSSALGTKTRLMGVIALKVHWTNTKDNSHFIQWFLLDAEEHGIYDYISIVTSKEEEIDLHTDRFMGSLGGKKVSLSEKEVNYLIKTFTRMNYKYNQPLPPPNFEYNFIIKRSSDLTTQEQKLLTYKIYENIDSPIQVVNYFLMRVASNDDEGKIYLFGGQNINRLKNFKIVDRASVLLKNEVRLVKNLITSKIYSVKSIIDSDEGYLKVISLIEVKKIGNEYRVTRAKLIDKNKVDYEVVANDIKNPEHLIIFDVLKNELEEKLLKIKPKLLKYEFENGKMFVEFRKNNDHVKKEDYHLGADLIAIYYIGNFNEFIICYYDLEDLYEINNIFKNGDLKNWLNPIKSVSIKGSIIYQYAQNGNGDFISYLESIMKEDQLND